MFEALVTLIKVKVVIWAFVITLMVLIAMSKKINTGVRFVVCMAIFIFTLFAL